MICLGCKYAFMDLAGFIDCDVNDMPDNEGKCQSFEARINQDPDEEEEDE